MRLVAVGVCLAAACSNEEGVKKVPADAVVAPWDVEVQVTGRHARDEVKEKVRVAIDGVPMTGDGLRGWRFTGHRAAEPPVLKAIVDTACGDVEVPVTTTRRDPMTMYGNIEAPELFAVRLLVDNRRGDELAFEVGTRTYRVAAGAAVIVPLVGLDPSCATVKRGGDTLGSIAVPPADPSGYRPPVDIVLDPTAKRCYQLRSEYYTSFPLDTRPRPYRKVFGPGAMLLLPYRVEFLFKKAPSKMTMEQPAALLYELTETACKRR